MSVLDKMVQKLGLEGYLLAEIRPSHGAIMIHPHSNRIITIFSNGVKVNGNQLYKDN